MKTIFTAVFALLVILSIAAHQLYLREMRRAALMPSNTVHYRGQPFTIEGVKMKEAQTIDSVLLNNRKGWLSADSVENRYRPIWKRLSR